MPAEDPLHKLALAALDAHAAIDDLTDGATSGRVSFAELYSYVNDASFVASGDFEARMKNTPKAQENLHRLIQRSAVISMPRLAAAASGETLRREVEGAVLTLMPSKANTEQLYLIVELIDSLPREPKHLLAMRQHQMPVKLALPVFSEGRAQSIIEEASDIALALMAPETEVYLI